PGFGRCAVEALEVRAHVWCQVHSVSCRVSKVRAYIMSTELPGSTSTRRTSKLTMSARMRRGMLAFADPPGSSSR
ncbi:hypothetical protein A2U01_0096782, partial [Trifolium medium]|nr:hypothetical protein [Trifolium medium]